MNQVIMNNLNIINAVTFDNKSVLIDINDFIDNEMLEGAKIFKILFKIEKNCEFGNFPFNSNEQNQITILKDLGICSLSWFQFISFIKNGFPPYYSISNLDNSVRKNVFIKILENLNNTCITLGGIPSFDLFYKEFYEVINENIIKYNPTKPSEDNENLYQWKLCRDCELRDLPIDTEWSVTNYEYNNNSFVVWLKKLKN